MENRDTDDRVVEMFTADLSQKLERRWRRRGKGPGFRPSRPRKRGSAPQFRPRPMNGDVGLPDVASWSLRRQGEV